MDVRLFFLLCLTRAIIPPGTLDGLLNSSEISKQIQNLTLFYSSLSVEDELVDFDLIHFSNFSSFPSHLKKVKILVIGGFFAGFPISAYQVLQLADFIAFDTFAGNEKAANLMKSHEFWFLPVVNLKAFQLMEEGFEGEEFLVIQTGLEGNDLNCTEVDTGINPYLNFPLFFEKENKTCSNQFSGNQPLESVISKMVFDNFFKDNPPNIVVNYQGAGRKYLIPPGNPGSKVSEKFLEYCSEIALPDGFELASRINYTGTAFGTFLDFSYNYSQASFEIALDSTREPAGIVSGLTENYQSFLDIVSKFMPIIDVKDFVWDDYQCNKTNLTVCHYHSYLAFTIRLMNSGFSRFRYALKFHPGFENIRDFTPVSVFRRYNGSNWTEVEFYDFPISQTLSINDTADGYSEFYIKIIYGKITKKTLKKFNSVSTFISQEFLVDDLVFEYSYKKKDDESHENKRNPIVVGWILMGVIFLVVGVAALLLRFVKTGEISKGLTQEHPKRADVV